ncbi:hypothetical protein A9996_05275 [Gelidibacter algens]|nr:hypothetical protein A9996_05275 [Gelidibacter algens]
MNRNAWHYETEITGTNRTEVSTQSRLIWIGSFHPSQQLVHINVTTHLKKKLRNKTKFYLLISILGIIIQSCASFDKKLINPNSLNKRNLTELNGRYGIVHLEFDSISKEYKKQIWTYNNFFKEIDRKLIKDTLKLDSLKTYTFNLKVISPKKIKIDYIENGKIFKERILKTKLKKDGYLYLKNKNVQFLLVPYIAGALDVKKTRFTKSKNGNLIF